MMLIAAFKVDRLHLMKLLIRAMRLWLAGGMEINSEDTDYWFAVEIP